MADNESNADSCIGLNQLVSSPNCPSFDGSQRIPCIILLSWIHGEKEESEEHIGRTTMQLHTWRADSIYAGRCRRDQGPALANAVDTRMETQLDLNSPCEVRLDGVSAVLVVRNPTFW